MSDAAHDNRRRFERVFIQEGRWLACQATGEGVALDGEVCVLGLGGMFIRTAKVQPIGARVGIIMRNIADIVEADCVVRNNHHEGFGIEFVALAPKARRNLERILCRLKEPQPQNHQR